MTMGSNPIPLVSSPGLYFPPNCNSEDGSGKSSFSRYIITAERREVCVPLLFLQRPIISMMRLSQKTVASHTATVWPNVYLDAKWIAWGWDTCDNLKPKCLPMKQFHSFLPNLVRFSNIRPSDRLPDLLLFTSSHFPFLFKLSHHYKPRSPRPPLPTSTLHFPNPESRKMKWKVQKAWDNIYLNWHQYTTDILLQWRRSEACLAAIRAVLTSTEKWMGYILCCSDVRGKSWKSDFRKLHPTSTPLLR